VSIFFRCLMGIVARMLLLSLMLLLSNAGQRGDDDFHTASLDTITDRHPAACDAYTYVPTPLSDAQLALWYPNTLRVVGVQVVLRHGERVPTADHFPDFLPKIWQLCWSPEIFGQFTAEGTTASFVYRDLDQNGTPVVHPTGHCDFGQLTDKGRSSLVHLGAHLRNLYAHQLRLLPSTWTSADDVFVRATDSPRTQHSALSLLVGLYPPPSRPMSSAPPRLYTVSPNSEYIHPTRMCPRAKQWWEEVRDANPALPAAISHLRAEHPAVASYIDACQDSGHSVLSAVSDTFVTLLAHGLPLPPNVTVAAVRDLWAVVSLETWQPYQTTPDLSRLIAGRLIGELVDRIDAATAGNPFSRLAVYSAHDITVGPLLATLGLFDGRLPTYAATVQVELLKETADTGRFHLRLWYNGRPLPLPFCDESANPPHICPWPIARKRLDELRLSPEQYTAQCRPRHAV
jgi:acid phosphatase